LSRLPKGWIAAKINDLFDINPGHRGIEVGDNIEVSFVPMPSIEEATGKLNSELVKLYGEVKRGYSKFIENDVVFAKITPCMENGKVAIAKDLKNGIGCGTTELHVFRPLVQETSLYLLYFLLQESIREAAKQSFKGTSGHLRVPVGFFDEIDFPLPPLSEQHRIVEKLKVLLGKMDACQHRMAKLPLILKRFRQSILDAACSGRLTADWREEKGAGEGSEELPEEWRWSVLNEVCDSIVDCPHSTPRWTETGKLCVRTTNFKPGFLDLSEKRFVSEETFLERIRRLCPMPGDVLYSREGSILGIACIIPPGVELCLGQRMMLFRTNPSYRPELLMHWLNSTKILNRVRELTGGTASPHLNVRDIKRFPVPLPPLPEQNEIVRRVKDLFALADQLEARYAKAKAHIDQLSQSILAKAFRGELVPQDENDEPAEVLLERIRAQRAQATPPRHTRTTQRSPSRKRPPKGSPAPPPPLVAEALDDHTRNVPQIILAHMQPGVEYSRAEIVGATGITSAKWAWSIKQLKSEGKVLQTGERRGARYRLWPG